MDVLVIDAAYQSAFTKLGLTSCDAITKFFAETEPLVTTTVFVKPQTLRLPDDSVLSVFYKQYEYQPAPWRFLGRTSKARREFDNYGAFRRLGIPCPDRVACGEQRDRLGRLCRAFVITATVPRAWTLLQFVEEFCPNRSTTDAQHLRDELVRHLAAMTRCIHSKSFFHHDLVVRNVLVTWHPPEPPMLWWIDCPRGAFARFRRHRRRIKDLASLDKGASRITTARERLSFLKLYLATPRLDPDARQLARDVLDYRKQRWPDDWP